MELLINCQLISTCWWHWQLRGQYISQLILDKPADPKGEFLSGKFAGAVYALYGKKGLGVDDQPSVDTPVGETIGYHVRSGGHDILLYDWKQFIRFANKNLLN